MEPAYVTKSLPHVVPRPSLQNHFIREHHLYADVDRAGRGFVDWQSFEVDGVLRFDIL